MPSAPVGMLQAGQHSLAQKKAPPSGGAGLNSGRSIALAATRPGKATETQAEERKRGGFGHLGDERDRAVSARFGMAAAVEGHRTKPVLPTVEREAQLL